MIAVITIITTILLLQQRRFDSSTLLRSLAYNVALSIRQAQLYGTSVRQFGTSANSFNYSYGVYFSSGDNKHYYLFADVDNNQQRTDATEDVQAFSLNNGYSISQFCGVTSGVKSCNVGSDAGGNPITYLTIYFKRPNPDAQFSSDTGDPYASALITLVGADGTSNRSVVVTGTGQISVSTTTQGI